MTRTFHERIIGAVLVAALLFNAFFPIPMGVRAVDEFRAQRADAVAPAVVAAVQVFATALAAYGVYAAGQTLSEWNANEQALYEKFAEHNGVSTETLDGAFGSAVDASGNVVMGSASLTPYLGDMSGFANWLVGNGFAEANETSRCASSAVRVSGWAFPKADSLGTAFGIADVQELHAQLVSEGYELVAARDSGNRSFYRYDKNPRIGSVCETTGVGVGRYAFIYVPYEKEIYFNREWVITRGGNTQVYSSNYLDYCGYTERIELIDGVAYTSTAGDDVQLDYSVLHEVTAGVSQKLLDGTVTVDAAAVYQPFTPTADQLVNGYDSTAVLEAEVAGQGATIGELQNQINEQATAISALQSGLKEQNDNFETQTAALAAIVDKVNEKVDENAGEIHVVKDATSAISARVAALEAQGEQDKADLATVIEITRAILAGVNPLNGDLVHDGQTVAALVASFTSPVAAIGTAVGAISKTLDAVAENEEDFQGTLIGDIAALHKMVGQKVDTLSDTFGKKVDELLDALGDTALGGLIKQILGLLKQVIEGEFSLANILEAIRAIPSTLADALAGALEAAASQFMGEPSGGDPFKVVPAQVGDFGQELRDKAPWAYVLALQDAFATVSGSYSARQSFYVDVPLYMAGTVRFDAGGFLSQGVNGFTIAYLIRVLLTAAICVSLLMVAYKAMERVTMDAG